MHRSNFTDRQSFGCFRAWPNEISCLVNVNQNGQHYLLAINSRRQWHRTDGSSCCHYHCDRIRAPMLSTAFPLLLIVSRDQYIDKYDSRGFADIQLARLIPSPQIDKQETRSNQQVNFKSSLQSILSFPRQSLVSTRFEYDRERLLKTMDCEVEIESSAIQRWSSGHAHAMKDSFASWNSRSKSRSLLFSLSTVLYAVGVLCNCKTEGGQFSIIDECRVIPRIIYKKERHCIDLKESKSERYYSPPHPT